MDAEELISRHPRVFHTMAAAAWPSVQLHGLLSTVRLIDLFGLDAAEGTSSCARPGPAPSFLRRPAARRP